MNKWLNLIVIAISVSTVIAGLTQVVMPGFVLGFVGAMVTPTSSHFFAIVGMFMALFGGLMLHAIYSASPQKPAILWCSLQKIGASAAVVIGIFHGIFAPIAGSVALFDLCSGLLFLYYLKKMAI